MSQAQIAGGSVSQQNELPAKGRRLHDFELIGAVGGTVRLSDYRGRANLVVIATDGRPETAKLLSDAAGRYGEIKDEKAELLAVLHAPCDQAVAFKQRLNLPYPVLADPEGRLHRDWGAVDSQGHDSAAVYVTDRFGEVFGVYRTAGGQPLPGIADVLDWLEFVNAQRPECEPPEWPV